MTNFSPRNMFSTRILDGYHLHGRKNLPWQIFSEDQNQNTYRVWLSAPVSIAAAAYEVEHA